MSLQLKEAPSCHPQVRPTYHGAGIPDKATPMGKGHVIDPNAEGLATFSNAQHAGFHRRGVGESDHFIVSTGSGVVEGWHRAP